MNIHDCTFQNLILLQVLKSTVFKGFTNGDVVLKSLLAYLKEKPAIHYNEQGKIHHKWTEHAIPVKKKQCLKFFL